MLIPFVYTLFYTPFLLSYLPNYSAHSFYTFTCIDLLLLVLFRIVHARLPLVSQFQVTFLYAISLLKRHLDNVYLIGYVSIVAVYYPAAMLSFVLQRIIQHICLQALFHSFQYLQRMN